MTLITNASRSYLKLDIPERHVLAVTILGVFTIKSRVMVDRTIILPSGMRPSISSAFTAFGAVAYLSCRANAELKGVFAHYLVRLLHQTPLCPWVLIYT